MTIGTIIKKCNLYFLFTNALNIEETNLCIKTTYRSKSFQFQQAREIRRCRQVQMDTVFHHKYVMKLFDRSVDLAQFQENTPLYPICRAWMANQPRNPNLISEVHSPSPEVVNEINKCTDILDINGDIPDVYHLPSPIPCYEGPLAYLSYPLFPLASVAVS